MKLSSLFVREVRDAMRRRSSIILKVVWSMVLYHSSVIVDGGVP